MLNKFKLLTLSLVTALSLVVPSANATVITGIPTLTIGGRTFTDLTNIKILAAYNTSTNNTTFRVQGTTTGYQVTSGKTLHIYAAKVIALSGSSCSVPLQQSDNDVGVNTATAITNSVYAFGVNAGNLVSPASAGGTTEFSFDWPVASQKYVTINGAGNPCIFFLYGYEQ